MSIHVAFKAPLVRVHLYHTPKGTPVCTLTVKIDPHDDYMAGTCKNRGTGGELVITTYGRMAKECDERLSPGDMVAVGGHLSWHVWESGKGQHISIEAERVEPC